MSNLDIIGNGKAGRMFVAANVSAKILTVVGTAMTGLVVYNPTSSMKRLVFLSAGFSWTTVSPSACSIGLAISPTGVTVPSSLTVGGAVVASADGGNSTSVARAWDVATLGAACAAVRWFGGAQWITGGTGQFPYCMTDKIDGELGLMPGASIAFCMIGGTGPTGLASLSFVETDL